MDDLNFFRTVDSTVCLTHQMPALSKPVGETGKAARASAQQAGEGRRVSPLLNRAAARRMILERALVVRPGVRWARVSDASVDWLEARIRVLLDAELHRQPSNGVTVRLGG